VVAVSEAQARVGVQRKDLPVAPLARQHDAR
jgi:hypothetical protein